MTREKQKERLNILLDKIQTIQAAKGDDYAGEDRLANFKNVGTICNLDPRKVILVMIATKVTRLITLLDSKESPKNESIEDSILDLASYGSLLDQMNWEMTPKTEDDDLPF